MFLSTVASFNPGEPGGDTCSLIVSSRLDGAYPESLLPFGSGIGWALAFLFGVLKGEVCVMIDFGVCDKVELQGLCLSMKDLSSRRLTNHFFLF